MGFWDKVRDAMAGEDAVRREQPVVAAAPEPAQPPVTTVADPETPAAAAPVPDRSYTVLIGETLAQIAAREGLTPDAIATASGVKHQDRIYPGLVLTLPATSVQQS